jgi:thiamine pyrophosphate-dependent acetolactate synthase large subunit-like protein
MLAIQYALESDVDTVFIITSGWRHMARYETKEELAEYLKDMRWTEKNEKEWVAAVGKAQTWLKEENEKRKAKGIPQRVIRSIHEVVAS